MPDTVRIGVDTGGTFTDLVLDPGDGARLLHYKLLSTPSQPEQAVIDGVRAILALWRERSGPGAARDGAASTPLIIHGSTVATNALLEGKGARTAYVTTAGFEDVLFLGRQNRSELYALEPSKPVPPLLPEHCLGVQERLAFDGEVLTPLAEGEPQRLVQRVRDSGVASVALSLLHSYANPAHEQRLAQALRSALPGLHVTVSSELLPEFREYERGMACLLNAAVAPRMQAYIGALAAHCGTGRLRIMASAGGTLPPAEVLRTPAQTVLSGPAGGVLGALAQARAAGVARIITFDMGGTSTDVALCDGAPTLGLESEINGLPLRLPALAIHTVGAGGGSIAWVDSGGALRAGPQSAGADPGPACYGRQQGELQATVTDAHVVLGHLDPQWPLAGSLRLDAAASQTAVARVAAQAGLGLERTAEGILRVAEVVMARAVRRISLERGHDPREYVLLPFGGAGGLHAARLAEQLGLRRVLVPTLSGLLSAAGMLCAAPLYTFSRAVLQRVAPEQQGALLALPPVQAALEQLRRQGVEALARDGLGPEQQRLEFSLDLRYTGQSYEINTPLADGNPAREFARRHEELYGYCAPERALEVVAARVTARGEQAELQLPELEPRAAGSELSGYLESARIYAGGGWTAAWSVERGQLCAGDALAGPGIVREYSATTLVPMGWRMHVLPKGQLLLEQVASEVLR